MRERILEARGSDLNLNSSLTKTPCFLAVTAKPQPYLHSLKSRGVFFCRPQKYRSNLSFQIVTDFLSSHNGAAISYFVQKLQPKAHGSVLV